MSRRSRSRPRGSAALDTLIGAVVVASLLAFVMRWYAGHDCENLEREALTLMPRVKTLAEQRAKELNAKIDVYDCAFTPRGMAGDCQKVGLTSAFPTTYAYVVSEGVGGYRVTAVGQTPETYGSILTLTETGVVDRTASRCE